MRQAALCRRLVVTMMKLVKMVAVGIIVVVIATPKVAWGANCSVTSVGLTPINDLGAGSYLGFQGGLYPGGANQRPASHESAGLALARSIEPMNANGNPDPNGAYVLLSIGMSNASQEFNVFIPDANADPDKDPDLVIVNGAQGSATASEWGNASGLAWSNVMQRLSDAWADCIADDPRSCPARNRHGAALARSHGDACVRGSATLPSP